MNFYHSGYGYEVCAEGYTLTHMQIESEARRKFVDAWRAEFGLRPDSVVIQCNDRDHFYSRDDAIRACVEHNKGRKVA